MTLSTSLPLSRRLSDSYAMFGLACVFLCVANAVLLTRYQLLDELLAISITLPLLVLLMGGIVLRRTVRVSNHIESQLLKAAQTGSLAGTLSPLPELDPAAATWNTILQQLDDQRIGSALEARLVGSWGSVEQQRWNDVFQSLSDGIAICDAETNIVQANNALAALLNADDSSSLSGRSLLGCIGQLGQSDTTAEQLSDFQGRTSLTRDVMLGPEPSAGVLRVSRVPVVGEAFSPNTGLWTIRDVTQQKLADAMRNQFLSTATHELRTPLTTIMAYAELLAQEDDLDVEKQKSFCNTINAEATRLSRFVDQLLNVNQMEAGALTLTRHETDIERLVGEVIENIRPQIRQKQIAFESKLPAKLRKLRVDKDKLAAALVNLLGNAVKYTPAEGRVNFTVEETAEQVHFHIEDTGIGISAEDLPRLSEKFFRSSDSRVRNITGSGLGLAFSQEIARLHGGRIAVTSELNKGSRFTLILPLQ